MKEAIISNKYHFSLLCLTKIESNNTIVSLTKIINGNVNVICYDSKDAIPSCLRSISQKKISSLSPLNVSLEEHDNIMDVNNRRESIKLERYISIGTQYTTYDCNGEFRYSN